MLGYYMEVLWYTTILALKEHELECAKNHVIHMHDATYNASKRSTYGATMKQISVKYHLHNAQISVIKRQNEFDKIALELMVANDSYKHTVECIMSIVDKRHTTR
jgi:hypothetical protein